MEHLLGRLATLKVGRTGYVYILKATGEQRGAYVLSLDRKRDGENIWESRDADGRAFIQDIIAKAVTARTTARWTNRSRFATAHRHVGEQS